MFFELVEKFLLDKKIKEFKRSQIIYHEGDIPTQVYFVESGMIGLFHISETGKETFFRRIFGRTSIFNDPTSQAQAFRFLRPLRMGVKVHLLLLERASQGRRRSPQTGRRHH